MHSSSALKVKGALHSLEALENIVSKEACRIDVTILQQDGEENTKVLLYLDLLTLPDHLRGDDNGPTCSDEEKEAKRMRSASISTPGSLRGSDPNDNHWIMGVSSVGPHKTARSGEGNTTDADENQEGIADNSGDIEEIRGGVSINATTQPSSGNDSGAGRDSWGYGRATLLECLNRFGGCASGESYEGSLPHTNPRQITKIIRASCPRIFP